ncbi:hypothetical protein MOTE_10250 [Moorella thermoacetica]|uniref:CARDB domain-containing protein n=1 Tax=Neomoorella thermoacetica TaxID=1525 RepID=A0A1J5NKW5_NEOTH|nr:hypothetical protein MOTE_10250 [Moorella thermoacetica]
MRKLKSTISILTLLSFLMISVIPVWAKASYDPNYGTEVKTFGFTDERNRESFSYGNAAFWPLMKDEFGKSFSQPLILSGKRWGRDGAYLVAAGGPGTTWLMFWKLDIDKLKDAGKKGFTQMANTPPYATLDLHDKGTTYSDPTYFEDGNRKYIYIGLKNGNLAIVDVTDIDNVNPASVKFNLPPSDIDPNVSATDITSAPYVTTWNGHTVAVTASGNKPWVLLWTDPLNEAKRNVIKIDVPAIRTSSSPGPLNGGFLIGCDNGLDNEGFVYYYKFSDFLTERADGKLEGSYPNYSRLSTRSSAVASFAVDPDEKAAYYNDSRANVYKFNIQQGQLIEAWHYYFPGVTFTHRSPALTGSNVYVPIGTRKDLDGQGGLLVVDRNGNEVKRVYFGSKVGTAPVVWRYQNGATVMVGTQGSRPGIEGTAPGETPNQAPAIALLDAMNGYNKYGAITMDELRPTGEAFGTGISGQISMGSLEPEARFSVMALTHSNGIYVWAMLPFDMKAEIVDTGVPAGQKAEPGHKYTARVKFTVTKSPNDILGGDWYGWVSVGAFHQVGGQGPFYHATLKDASGKEMLYEKDSYDSLGVKRYLAEVKNTGDSFEATFDWTAPNGVSETVLAAAVNVDYPPLDAGVSPANTRVNNYVPEINYGDNVATVKVPVRANCDVAVEMWPVQSPIRLSWLPNSMAIAGANIRIKRVDDSPSTVKVTVTADGPEGRQTFTETLGPGETKLVGPYHFTVRNSGTYTVRAEAWPDVPDANPANNKASTPIEVIKTPAPPTGPKEPGIHGELVG